MPSSHVQHKEPQQQQQQLSSPAMKNSGEHSAETQDDFSRFAHQQQRPSSYADGGMDDEDTTSAAGFGEEFPNYLPKFRPSYMMNMYSKGTSFLIVYSKDIADGRQEYHLTQACARHRCPCLLESNDCKFPCKRNGESREFN